MASTESAPGDKTAEPMRVLVIEDHPDGRETLKLLMRLAGHQVEVAEDGVQGIDKALAWKPDVALIDVGLPGLDGFEVARRLREARGSDIYLIAHTGYGQPTDRQHALEAGFDAHLVKPVDWPELVSCLQLAQAARGSSDRAAPERLSDAQG